MIFIVRLTSIGCGHSGRCDIPRQRRALFTNAFARDGFIIPRQCLDIIVRDSRGVIGYFTKRIPQLLNQQIIFYRLRFLTAYF
ncbi:Uncharacterised protein [Salmonella enterica subsp. enterica]|uniref:Uncharacterized protein n=1 Tax=Salmonella enterica I TaxID=59201 RepID=A0A379WMP0_SALET|nr:Uncharacterised protein [Salmonella enterica subsp. enterica]